MKLYSIKDWHHQYENNRTRELKKIDWVPVPNKHDGDGYAMMMEQKDGPALLGSWIAIIQVASKCDARGTLLRDSKIPHDSASIARQSRFPISTIERAITFFSSREIGWLEVSEFVDDLSIPQEPATIPQANGSVPHDGAPRARAMKGREGKEGREPKRREAPFPKLLDEEFLKTLKGSTAYRGVDIDAELAKMDLWLLTPKGRGRKKTCQFVLNWMNRADRTLPPENHRPPPAPKPTDTKPLFT